MLQDLVWSVLVPEGGGQDAASLLSRVSGVRWGGVSWRDWSASPRMAKLVNAEGLQIGRLDRSGRNPKRGASLPSPIVLTLAATHPPPPFVGAQAFLDNTQYELRGPDRPCVGYLVGPTAQRQYTWVLGPDGREVASLVAEGGHPARGFKRGVNVTRFRIFVDGVEVGSMDPEMTKIRTDGYRTMLHVTKDWRGRYVMTRSMELPERLLKCSRGSDWPQSSAVASPAANPRAEGDRRT